MPSDTSKMTPDELAEYRAREARRQRERRARKKTEKAARSSTAEGDYLNNAVVLLFLTARMSLHGI